MLIPPILEIYVVWHPSDQGGREIAEELFEHFHGTTYSGLIGGAVEVYSRSIGWLADGGAPRPLPFMEPLPGGISPALVTAVVPVLGTHLARAVQENVSWRNYIAAMAASATADDCVGVFPLLLDESAISGTTLNDLVGVTQSLDPKGASDGSTLCRDLSHSVAGLVGDPMGSRLQVFISHTKRYSPDEEPDDVLNLVKMVREVIHSTHLAEFFDEADIQPGDNWNSRLRDAASKSGLLVIRTDLFATREWCQREVLTAKRAQMPVVALHALTNGEERGSFLLDHVPSVSFRYETEESMRASIERALNLLVDEGLKRALWHQQEAQLEVFGFDWLPAHAPEPITMTEWLSSRDPSGGTGTPIVVLHPDPPLGNDEMQIIHELFTLVGLEQGAEVLTPRTFANRGGQIKT